MGIRCGDCKWWDESTTFRGSPHWRKCRNPESKGFGLWREDRNRLCKIGEERESEEAVRNVADLKYEKCAWCGKEFLPPDKSTWAYKCGRGTDGRKYYFHTWKCMRAWEEKNPKKVKYYWHGSPDKE